MLENVNTKTVAKINNVDILVIENGEKRVPLKPICEALGILFSSQLQKVKDDEILGSVVLLSNTTGKDGKEYQMQTIPFMYVFGWVFGISVKNVKEEAREALTKYKLECYKALYYHFTSYAEYVEQKQDAIEAQLKIVDAAKSNFNAAKTVKDDAEKQLKVLRQLTFADYDAENRQLKLFSNEEMEGGQDASTMQ